MADTINQFYTQSLRRFTRAVDEAGDWFYRDDVSLHQRTKQSTGVILRALNKIANECNELNIDFDTTLQQMYLEHVGRNRTKKRTPIIKSIS